MVFENSYKTIYVAEFYAPNDILINTSCPQRTVSLEWRPENFNHFSERFNYLSASQSIVNFQTCRFLFDIGLLKIFCRRYAMK